MSFFKHFGSKGSKFKFIVWVENVSGVYPASYTNEEHSADGVYLMIKRKNKSYRTKVALPEDGGVVCMNDCLQFESTLYQKKQKSNTPSAQTPNNSANTLLPKPFIIRVANGSNDKIRWQSNVDLTQFAYVAEGDEEAQTFTLPIMLKRKPKHIPAQVRVRIRVRCTWLQSIDSISQNSASSMSRVSSSVRSELSDVSHLDSYRLFDSIIENNPFNFSSLPEDHSIHDSQPTPKTIVTPYASAFSALRSPQACYDEQEEEDEDESSDKSSDKSCSSQPDNSSQQTADRLMPLQPLQFSSAVGNLHNMQAQRRLSNPNLPDFTLSFISGRPSNLSFVATRDDESIASALDDTTGATRRSTSVFNINIDSELIKTEETNNTQPSTEEYETKSADMITLTNEQERVRSIAAFVKLVVLQMKEIPMDRRVWKNLLPLHSAIVFRCFIQWNVFDNDECSSSEESDEGANMRGVLQRFVGVVTDVVHEQFQNELEQSYWLLRLVCLLYWLHRQFPGQLAGVMQACDVSVTRQESFEPILSPDLDDNEGEVVRCMLDTPSMGRMLDTPSMGSQVGNKGDGEDTAKIARGFGKKLAQLCRVCFANIMENTVGKLVRIPFEDVFEEDEHGSTESSTMDMIFALMNNVWFLFDELALYHTFRSQVCRQIMHFAVHVGLLNTLFENAAYCTMAGAFRLKVVRSLVADWCYNNGVEDDLFAELLAVLDEVSDLLLTCSAMKDAESVLNIAPSLSVTHIDKLLMNYNAEGSNDSMPSDVLYAISKQAANHTDLDGSIAFSQQPVVLPDMTGQVLPSLCLNDVLIPYQVSQHRVFKFLTDPNQHMQIIL